MGESKLSKVGFHVENLRRRGKTVAHKAYDVIKGSYREITSNSREKQAEVSETTDLLDKIKKELEVIDVWKPGVPPQTISNEKMVKMPEVLTEIEIEQYKNDKIKYINTLKKQIKDLDNEFRYGYIGVRDHKEATKNLREKIEFLQCLPDMGKERETLKEQMKNFEKEKNKLEELAERLKVCLRDDGDDYGKTQKRIADLTKKREKSINRRKDIIYGIDEATRKLFIKSNNGSINVNTSNSSENEKEISMDDNN